MISGLPMRPVNRTRKLFSSSMTELSDEDIEPGMAIVSEDTATHVGVSVYQSFSNATRHPFWYAEDH